MCLTTPVKIKKVKGGIAELANGRQIKLALVKAKAGDWVIASSDLAVAKISQKEADELSKYLEQGEKKGGKK